MKDRNTQLLMLKLQTTEELILRIFVSSQFRSKHFVLFRDLDITQFLRKKLKDFAYEAGHDLIGYTSEDVSKCSCLHSLCIDTRNTRELLASFTKKKEM